MAQRKSSTGRGGAIERDLVRKWARRQIGALKQYTDETWCRGFRHGMDCLITYLDKQPKRVKRAGGTGRK